MKIGEILIHRKIDEKQMNIAGMRKYIGTPKDRITIFLDKVRNRSPFTIKTHQGQQQVIIDPNEADRLEKEFNEPSDSKTIWINLETDDNQSTPSRIKLSDIVKTAEFGGEESGSREKLEQMQKASVELQLKTLLNDRDYIWLNLGTTADPVMVHAASVIKTPGVMKSDMTILDEYQQPVGWISLKAGKDFKWGGWQHLSGNPDITAWINRIKDVTTSASTGKPTLSPGQSFGLSTTAVPYEIKEKILFGKNFGQNYGVSNVNMILYGIPFIKHEKNDIYTLDADKKWINGQIPQGEYEPFLLMRYIGDRQDSGILHARGETAWNTQRNITWLDNQQQQADYLQKTSRQTKPKTT